MVQKEKLQADAAASKSKLKEVAGTLADTSSKLAETHDELTGIQNSVKSLKKEKIALKKQITKQKQRVPARIALAVKKDTAKAVKVTL